MKMFLEIGEIENVGPWFEEYVRTGQRRIMGIGHRVYKSTIRAPVFFADMRKRWRRAREAQVV